LVLATFKGNDMWVGAMMHRRADGSILRPQRTKGWHWWHEIDAAKRAGVISTVTVHEWIDYRPCACEPPMASIAELYQGRLRAGKNSAAGKSKKLVYNSSYGKLAQSIGNPRYANPIWASLITAGCRTMILDAIATHPTKTESLLMVATDGIVFKEPHPSLDVDKERLGAWEAGEYENLSLFLPGLYWTDKQREEVAAGEAPSLKSRGVPGKDLAKVITRVDTLWEQYGPDQPPPQISLPIAWGMTSGKLAITRNAWWTCGHIDRDLPRVLDAGSLEQKRATPLVRHWGGLRSFVYEYPDGPGEPIESTYYSKGFGEDEMYGDLAEHLVTPDAPSVADAVAWALHNR